MVLVSWDTIANFRQRNDPEIRQWEELFERGKGDKVE